MATSHGAGVVFGAAGGGEFTVVQHELRVGKFSGELVGALIESVPPAGGVPGQQQQPDRRCVRRPIAHRPDKVREQRDVQVGIVDDQQGRLVEL